MTRLLHTADVHLSTDAPERRAALEAVLDRADGEDVTLVTIGGDLFDSDRDSEALRADLRGLFSDRPYSIVAIPGNHDAAAFGSDLYFGESFDAAVGEPFEHVPVPGADLRVTCLPYTSRAVDEVLLELADRNPFGGTEVLLLHCSLEAPFADASAGDEDGHRYFPVTRETLADLGFDYYLAGHFHSAHRVELPDGGTFVYPGPPASVTRAETGPRTVALVDTADESVSLERLDTFHYDSLEVTVTPGEEAEAIEHVADWVAVREDRSVDASITVDGHVALDEHEFHETLADASGDVPLENVTTGVADVLAHPLFQEFEAKLEERDLENESLREEAWERTVAVFSELSTGGRLP